MPVDTRVVITDCDHADIEPETKVATDRGLELVLAQARTPDEVVAAAADADAIVVQYAPITDDVLARLPRLRAIGRSGVGVDTVDVTAATARGIAVCNVPDYGTDDVSDHAIALAVSLARGIVRLDRGVRAGIFGLEQVKPLHRISTRTFGVLGLGRIGRATARKAHSLGYTVLGSDPLHPPGGTVDGIAVVSPDDLLGGSDVVSLHVPLGADTHHLIDGAALARMRPGAVLVNTCRGGVVDTAALVDALRTGRLAGAGLDVFESEPLPADSPLLRLSTVVLTPHAAWYSAESYRELKRRVLENVADVCAGRRPRDMVNPEVLEAGRDGAR